MTDIFLIISSLAALVLILGSLAGFLGRRWWLFDLFSHFRGQYFLGLLVGFLFFWAIGKSLLAIACGVVSLMNLSLILPLYRKTSPHYQAYPLSRMGGNPHSTHPTVYRALLANVLQSNQEFDRMRKLIQVTNPDLIMLIEVNRTWIEQLQTQLDFYPYSLKPLREDNYGLSLFSRIPFDWSEVIEFGSAKVPSVLARLNLNGKSLTVIGTHPPPPKRPWMARQRDEQLSDIANYIASLPGPLMLLGDLNITSWSPHFQDLLRTAKLKDSRQGWGLHASWPVDRLPFLVPIDHILVSRGIAIRRRWLGPYIGSDHFPVLVEFSLLPDPLI